MSKKTKKKILILGSCAKEYALAKKFSQEENVEQVFVASGNAAMSEFCTCVDIREDDAISLLEFAFENGIDLTIASSEKSIKSDVVSFFQQNGLMIFGPTAMGAEICTSKSVGKKFIYKLRLPSAKFGVFDKQNLALDYVAKSPMPVVVKTDEHRIKNGTLVCSSYSIAKSFIEDCFFRNESRVIIEDYIWGHEFSFYVITDGYNALPLNTVANYKFSLDGDGGLLTSGMGCYSPNYKISEDIEKFLMHEIIFPTLDALSAENKRYVGIIGVDAVLTPENDVVVLEYNPFLQEHDCQGILELLDENLYDLISSCVDGSFGEKYKFINNIEDFAVSCVLASGNVQGSIISGLEDLEPDTNVAHFNTLKNEYLEYLTNGDRTLLLTKTAKTISRAVENLYEEVKLINFEGKRHRKDLCNISEVLI